MDVKIKTSEMLLRKLTFGCDDAQLQAVAEIRLFAKWDDANRVCLGRVGAIEPLIRLLQETADARVQENAVSALLNMSINGENKLRMVLEEGRLEAVMQLASEGASGEVKANAAALIYSLVVDDEARRILGPNERAWATVVKLLRDGSARCKAEALKALFVAAGDNAIRENLLKEDLQLISLLISMITVGKVKLTEDCLAVLALLASCGAGAEAITQSSTSIPILVYLVNSGSSPRVQENAASVLVNICENKEGEAQNLLPLQALVPGLNRLHRGGSERGKAKAKALLGLLGLEQPPSLPTDPNADFNPILGPSSVPLLPTRPRTPLPHQSTPVAIAPSSSHAPLNSTASWPKPTSRSRLFSFARNLFTHRTKRKSQST